MDIAKDGCTKDPMYKDEMPYGPPMEPWPPKDMSETARNQRRRIQRNEYDENTR